MAAASTQKVKEAMTKMVKNNYPFCCISLGQLSFSDLQKIAIATYDFKSGKDSFMCTNKLTVLVSYEGFGDVAASSEEMPDSMPAVAADEAAAKPAKCLNIAINANINALSAEDDDFYGYASLAPEPEDDPDSFGGMLNMLQGKPPTAAGGIGSQVNGLFNYLLDNKGREYDIGSTVGKHADQLVYYASIEHENPFKAIDEVTDRFFKLMRVRKLMPAEDEEEIDFGEMADAGGIEW